MQHEIPTWIYLVISGVTAGAVLLQALVLVGMLFALKGALGRLNEVSKKAEENVLPLLATSRTLLEEVSPKLRVAAQNALEISQTAKEISVKARMPAHSSRRPLKSPPTIMPKPATETMSWALCSPPTRVASSGNIGGIAASVRPTAALGAIITA